MYSKFDVGYRMINEKGYCETSSANLPLWRNIILSCNLPNVNTLPGTTSMVTPIAKSTPVTQASQMPIIPTVSSQVKDILDSSLNE